MNHLDIQPIPNEPALFIKDKKIIVIADLHIGIERELREKGLQVPSQTKSMTKRLILLFKKYNPAEIVLLGDIKHNIPTSTIQERKDVKNFIEKIKEYGPIHILPGNHDGNIIKLLPSDILLHSSDGYVIENIGFIHGHRWPKEEIMQCEYIILAHTHPTIMLTDRLGYKTYESCWLRGSCKTSTEDKYPKIEDPALFVLPAFNPLCGGIAVNKDKIIGPFSKILDVDNSNVYLIDGSSLGKVKDIN